MTLDAEQPRSDLHHRDLAVLRDGQHRGVGRHRDHLVLVAHEQPELVAGRVHPRPVLDDLGDMPPDTPSARGPLGASAQGGGDGLVAEADADKPLLAVGDGADEGQQGANPGQVVVDRRARTRDDPRVVRRRAGQLAVADDVVADQLDLRGAAGEQRAEHVGVVTGDRAEVGPGVVALEQPDPKRCGGHDSAMKTVLYSL